MAQIFITITGAGTWTSPPDIPIIANSVKVECFGAGSGGNTSGGAGAGGAYSVSFLQLAVNTVYNLSVGAGGPAGVVGGDTWFNGVSFPNAGQACGARGGGAPSTTTGGTGGPAGAGSGAAGNGFWTGTGSRGFSGGNGGSLSTDAGGGGGAAGPNGNGTAGSNGSAGSGGNGGSGDNGSGGSGGAGGTVGSAGVGQPGTEITSAAGSGGGGGGCTTGIAGGGGNYGGSGGGALTTGTPGVGAQGLIVITFTSTNLVFSAFDPPAPSFGNPRNRANFINPRNFQDFVYLMPALPAPTTGGPLLGFDALGRFAIGQNPFVGALPNIYGGAFGIWPPASAPPVGSLNVLNRIQQRGFQDFVNAPGNPNQFFGYDFYQWPNAPRPHNYARDWIAFSGNFSVDAPVFTEPFSPFDLGRHARNSAIDWITQFGNISVDTLPIESFSFLPFAPGQHSPNFGKDWIAYSGNEFIEDFPRVGIDFSRFDPPASPRNFSKDWVAYSEIGFTVVPVNLIGIDFMPFASGLTRKLWTIYGQQPQWWTYEFKAPIKPKADKHDYGWPIRQYHRPHPVVYEQEYYDAVNKRWVNAPAQEEPEAPPAPHVPNLLIPISRLIQPRPVPSLHMAPPHRPVPTLHVNPPPFRLASKQEMDSDDEMIIRMLLEE